jgi:hypothetical protein
LKETCSKVVIYPQKEWNNYDKKEAVELILVGQPQRVGDVLSFLLNSGKYETENETGLEY